MIDVNGYDTTEFDLVEEKNASKLQELKHRGEKATRDFFEAKVLKISVAEMNRQRNAQSSYSTNSNSKEEVKHTNPTVGK